LAFSLSQIWGGVVEAAYIDIYYHIFLLVKLIFTLCIALNECKMDNNEGPHVKIDEIFNHH
jgi:hypothetical protein